MTADPRRCPVLVGVGQLRSNRERTTEGAREPLALAVEAAQRAADDAGSGQWLAEADDVTAVRTASWAYDDLPALLAQRVGARPRHTWTSPVGGQWPARLLDEAAERIATGRSQVAVVVGAEAQASAHALARAGVEPPWTAAPGGPLAFDLDDLGSPAMQASGVLLPVRVYPLFEARLRSDRGQSPQEDARESAELYAAFSRVAATNPAAWDPVPRTPEQVLAVGPGNRMVCEPYPLAVNARPDVDQAAAVVLTSLALARERGVPEDRLVHVWGGAGAADSADVLARPTFGGSPALVDATSRVLAATGVQPAALDVVDVYSCFPVVPKLVLRALGLPMDHVSSATGGHSSFGGPLNSYSLHAVVAVAGHLRAGARQALVHANGGYLTAQHLLVLGRAPHPQGYVGQPAPVVRPQPGPPLVPPQDGPAVVETATVEHARTGGPATGLLVARTPAGERFAASTAPGDVASARVLSLEQDGGLREVVGRTVQVRVRGGHVALTG